MDEQELLGIIERAARENVTELDLSGRAIDELPHEVTELTMLKVLDVSNNRLTFLPPEIERLTNLRELYLNDNKLITLPTQIGMLSNLERLYLRSNRIQQLPSQFKRLSRLRAFSLEDNGLSTVPTEIFDLYMLDTLHLHRNELTSLPPKIRSMKRLRFLILRNNRLVRIPPEIGFLDKLRYLILRNNALEFLPKEIGSLGKLILLDVHGNQLSSLPPEIGQLVNLEQLYLHDNSLTTLPQTLGRLENLIVLKSHHNLLCSIPPNLGLLKGLKILHLGSNKLESLPEELYQLTSLEEFFVNENQLSNISGGMAHLTNLKHLRLADNQLISIPGQLSKMKNLERLDLGQNQITTIPAELGELTNLVSLKLGGNQMNSPPPGIIGQGTEAILAYLREPKVRQWVSKLLIVGEGGVGKTSLLRALRGETFIEGLETTHGIAVEKLELSHPTYSNVIMNLNAWDFGGQQIYHATHQFFLTKRSVFLLVWDARHGWEAGKLYNWLDRIQANAPESPVMVVAAHIDERDAELPLDDLQRKYPQIMGHYRVSNKTLEGIEEFKGKLAYVAAELPLMGEEWPATWLEAANLIKRRTEHYISPKQLYRIMATQKVNKQSAIILANWLHELGDILYFKDDEELGDIVTLNPIWVSEVISKALESKEVFEKQGILTKAHRDILWADIDEGIREHFLSLMEKFDLSYRTLENREISLVVECLPLDPPDYRPRWEAIKGMKGCKEISMKFSLNTLPAGIPTWFIARSHRFTTHTHWRMGALFADSSEQRHLGLIEAYPYERHLQLTVRGPAPHNFFTLLRDGLELTLRRFPGLKIKRTMPCPGHDGGQCLHEFDFAQLQKAIESDKPVMEVQCQETFENVSVSGLLFGLHWKTESKVISRIDELEEKVISGQEEILTELRELRELTQRDFLRLFTVQQSLAESHCPNVFTIQPKDGQNWLKNLFRQKMVLQLFCQAPGEWHPAVEGSKRGKYEIMHPSEFFESVGPYIKKLAKVIKYATPVAGATVVSFAGPIGVAMGAEYVTKLTAHIKLMEELAKKLTERDYALAHMDSIFGEIGKVKRLEGMELRALRALLDKEDPSHEWGGLKKVLTPEGHYLWLCEHHAAEYKK